MREEWERVEQGQTAFLAGLSDAALAAEVDYRNVAGDPFRAPLRQLLRHVANHSTFHRGQVVTLLRQLGVKAVPATDFVVFCRAQAQRVGDGAEPSA